MRQEFVRGQRRYILSLDVDLFEACVINRHWYGDNSRRHGRRQELFNRPLKKWASNASGTLFSKKRVAQTRLRSDCTGQSGLFAGHLAHFGRTYPRAHA